MNNNSNRRATLHGRIMTLELFQQQIESLIIKYVSFGAAASLLNDKKLEAIIRLHSVQFSCRSIIKMCEIQFIKDKYIQELRRIDTK